jgi:Skp family chaperone for outer membrane proteins
MMKKGLFTTLLLVFGLLSLVQAQEKPLKIALINKLALLQAHPDGQVAAGLAQQQNTELAPLLEELQTLQAKSQTAEGLTPEERSRATLLVQTVEQTRQRYAADIQAAAAPAEEAINTALTAVSQANGYTLVIDGDLAGLNGLGLFVYVDTAGIPDITQQVIEQMGVGQ